MLQKQRPSWRGIRKHGPGWQAEVRVVGQPRAVRQFPLDTDVKEMQRWRRQEKDRPRTASPAATSGTFARDAEHYLKARRTMPSIKERQRHIALWVAEFGLTPRAHIKPWMIRAVRDRWLIRGSKARLAPLGRKPD